MAFNTTILAHFDVVGRGYPPHQFSVAINSHKNDRVVLKQVLRVKGNVPRDRRGDADR
jgi:hypothetical protein